MHEGAVLVLQSVPRTVCGDKQIFINPVIDYLGQRYPSLSWSALCFYSGIWLPDNSRSSYHLLGLRLFIIRRPDYPDAPYRKLSWSALFDYSGTQSPRFGCPDIRTYTKFLVCVYILCECSTTRTYT